MTGINKVGALLPDAYAPETVPQVGELDELETSIKSRGYFTMFLSY